VILINSRAASNIPRTARMHLRRIRSCGRVFRDRFIPVQPEVLRSTAGLEFLSPVTFFVGRTERQEHLLRAIARRCNIHIWEGIERAAW
jgi:hypothetical protein